MASLKKRGDTYYIQFYNGKSQRRISTGTDSLQIAKEKLRQFESAQLRGDDNPLPSKTPIADVVTAYIAHIRTVKVPKAVQNDIYTLRDTFGPICEALQVTSRKLSQVPGKRRAPKPGQDRRCRAAVIEASCFEQITTAQISEFISSTVRSRGLKPKTANRYREVLCRLFNWAMEQRGIRMPNEKNPAARVERYTEHAPEISFLTLDQIAEQLNSLAAGSQMQTMVAVLIYAGLRREELLWLTTEDVDWKSDGKGFIRIRAKTVNGERWQPKTKKNRIVPISSALKGYLENHQPRTSDGTWLFPSPDGHRWDPDNFARDLRRVNSEKGLKWGCLDFRHTFGSQLAMANVSLYKIATLMGNSPEICRRHYAALMPESLVDAVDFGSPVNASGSSVTLEG